MKKRLEIIHLRLTGARPQGLVEEIQKSIRGQDGLINVQVYHHAAISTDLGIHLHLDNKVNDPNISEFGVRLASALREYGIVEHTIWLEEKNKYSF